MSFRPAVAAAAAVASLVVACEIEPYKGDAGSSSTATTTDSGKYDCSKFSGYKKICPNDPSPAESPVTLCQRHTTHPKCGDLGAAIMECLWGLQGRKDMCGADGVTLAGRVQSLCGSADDANEECRAKNP